MNLHIVYSVLAIGAFITIMVWSMVGMSNTSKKFYDGLDAIEQKAIAATTSAELREIHSEFVKYANTYAVFRQYGDAARRVDAYIRGKLSGLDIL